MLLPPTLNAVLVGLVSVVPAAAQEPVRLVEDLVHREVDEAPLSLVRQIVPLDDGGILVVDAQDEGVIVLDASGRFVGRIGSRGDGPREFRSIGNVAVFGDTIAVSDPQLGRITFFTRNGAPIGDPITIQRRTGSRRVTLIGIGRDRGIATVVNEDTVMTGAWIVFGTADVDGREVARTPLDWGDRSVRLALPLPGGGEVGLVNPFAAGDYVAPHPYGDWLAVVRQPQARADSSGTVVLDVLGFNGERRLSLSLPYAPQRLTERMITDWLTAHRAFDELDRAGVLSRERAVRAARESYRAPQYLSALAMDGPRLAGTASSNAVFAAATGELWVRLRDGHWRVVRPGQRTMTVAAPPGTLLLAASGDHVWGVRRGAHDVPVIVRYRLQP